MTSPTPPSRPREVPLIDRLREATAGRYTIHAELGVGGMATVFRATEISLEREVAIKVMSTEMSLSPGAFERFAREARVAAALSHPHIVPIYAIGDDPALAFFAMKFIEGRGLDSILRKEGAQPVETVVRIIGTVGRALAHAHERGVVHRDVKPANIMVGNDGWIYVTDFGIAKRDDKQQLTQAGTVIGTPAYMSPEQFNGQPVTGAADQYSLGVVAFEMLTGRAPFDGPSLGEVMRGHLLEPPPPLRSLRVDVPIGVAEVVNRMLDKDPAKRFPSLADAATALEQAASVARGPAGRRSGTPTPRVSTGQATTPRSSPTTPIPRTNPAIVTSGAARRPVTAEQRRPPAEPESRGLSPVLLLLGVAAVAGLGWFVLKDKLAPSAPSAPAQVAAAPAPDLGLPPAAAPDSVVAGAESTLAVARDSATSARAIDSAIADLALRVASAPVIDLIAPRDSVVVRVGSQTMQTVLFVNGNQVGIVGGQGLVETTVPAGPLTIAIKRVGCTDWDTSYTPITGRRYTFVERSPRC